VGIVTVTIVVPAMDSIGWVVDVPNKLDRLLAYFYYSDYKQSDLYAGEIVSLPRILQLVGNKANMAAPRMEDALKLYLGKHFDKVNVEVSVVSPGDLSSTTASLKIMIGVNDAGKHQITGDLVLVSDGKIEEVVRMNNGVS
jgi:hypothetical protein